MLKNLWCAWPHMAPSKWNVTLKRWREAACPAVNVIHHEQERFSRQRNRRNSTFDKNLISLSHILNISRKKKSFSLCWIRVC